MATGTNEKYPGERSNVATTVGDENSTSTGIWIGIDLGTSNSSCAVWDSTRGSPKWMRLPKVASIDRGGKIGRIMPSVVRWVDDAHGNDDDDHDNDEDDGLHPRRRRKEHQQSLLVGAPALVKPNEHDRSSLLQSVKRLLGKRYDELDPEWIQSFDFDIIRRDDSTDGDHISGIQLVARTSGPHRVVTTTPQAVLAHELHALRIASQSYLDRFRRKKGLQVPGAVESPPSSNNDVHDNGSNKIRNVIVGVPAHFSQRMVRLVEDACREAGFDGHVGTCLESTAAAMAYGITLQENPNDSHKHTIMVIDMGGGTTDITIATKRASGKEHFQEDAEVHSSLASYHVLFTQGDERLGGDDIDQAILEFCLKQESIGDSNKTEESEDGTLEATDMLKLRADCRKAKESLCRRDDPSTSETITVRTGRGMHHKVVITQSIFKSILEPWLERAKGLILNSLEQLDGPSSTSSINIDEVVLVGGTTRIPAIRQTIQSLFPNIELSTSLDPMSSVAQGLAIQAAIVSKCVPLHQLKSALMLDCIPHAIGVLIPNGSHDGEDDGSNDDHQNFVEIIPRNSPLPARGSATFFLADKHQRGVTIRAVEEIGDVDNRSNSTGKKRRPVYERMSKEDFTFLLHRLAPDELNAITSRSLEVGMMVDTDGKFIVSIFDERDPEQVRKKQRYERSKQNSNGNEKLNLEVVGKLGYVEDLLLAESGSTTEQFVLVMMLIGVIVIYIGVRMAFTDPSLDGARII